MPNLIGTILCTLGKALGGCDAKPVTTPTINPCAFIGINEMSSILLDKLEAMGDDKAEIYLPDTKANRIYRKADVIKFLGLDETNKIVYIEETHDCDDFAAEMFGKGMGLIWTQVHALNYFVDENRVLYFIEPQTDKISLVLENWQGWDVRLFIGR